MASDVIGDVALTSGYDVKKADTLGMAQRGGSVVSQVRIGRQVWSPLVKKGDADILVAFEKLEAARWGNYLRPEGIAIINNQVLPPLAVSLGYEQYPSDEEIIDILKQRTDNIYFINGTSRVIDLGNIRALNTFMLGCVTHFVPFKVQTWKDCVSQRLPSKVRRVNIMAFNRGREEIRDAHI